jgi:hypothetical protein
MHPAKIFILASCTPALLACGDVYYNPNPPETGKEIIQYTNFQIAPKHLDPVISYASDESLL